MLNFLRQASVTMAVTMALSFAAAPQLVLANNVLPAAADSVNLTELPVTVTEQSGNVLLSDSPEMVPADGITYQDTVSGDARLFFHHVNDTKEPKKIVAMLANEQDKAADVIVTRQGLGGPGFDYLAVGKTAQMNFFAKQEVGLIEVPAKGTVLLEPKLNEAVVEPGALVNGIYEIRTQSPVKIIVMMLPVNVEPAEFVKKAQVLPADSHHLRGTFPGMDRLLVPTQVYNSLQDGAMAITLADHKIDTYVSGIDATDGSKTLNYGNYGVVYKLFLPTAFEQNYAVYLNPRGGEFAGGMKLKYRHQDEQMVGVPADKLFFGSKTSKDAAYLGEFAGGQSLWLTFSPPGASNLPVKLVLAPAAKTK